MKKGFYRKTPLEAKASIGLVQTFKDAQESLSKEDTIAYKAVLKDSDRILRVTMTTADYKLELRVIVIMSKNGPRLAGMPDETRK